MSCFAEAYVLCKKFTKEFCDQYLLPGQAGAVELGTSWKGSGPYTQTVTLQDYEVTNKTQVDLLINSDVYQQMMQDNVECIYIINDGGVLTAIAEGNRPTVAVTIPAIYKEVL